MENLHSNSNEESQFYVQFYIYTAEEMVVFICDRFISGSNHPQMK